MDVETQPALFEEPERVEPRMDGPWRIGPAPHQWRWVLIGEDADTLLIYGHSVEPLDVIRLLIQLPETSLLRAEAEEKPVRQTYARVLHCCPTHHPPLLDDPFCEWCDRFEPTGSEHDHTEWWDWFLAGAPRPADGWPAYFPVTLVDLEP